MPKAKKTGFTAVHPLSRKAKQMARQASRRDKLNSKADASDRPDIRKLVWFQEAVSAPAMAEVRSLTPDQIQQLVERFLSRHSEDLAALEGKARTSVALVEQLVKREHDAFRAGALYIPDLSSKVNLARVRAYDGSSGSVCNIAMVRVRDRRPSLVSTTDPAQSFHPKLV